MYYTILYRTGHGDPGQPDGAGREELGRAHPRAHGGRLRPGGGAGRHLYT